MQIFDLHCDTLTECVAKGLDLVNETTQLSLDRLAVPGGWCQAFAVFIPDEVRGPQATAYFEKHYRFYLDQLQRHRDMLVPVHTAGDLEKAFSDGKVGALLTVEGGAVLRGDPKRVAWLRGMGVQMLTLTWNGANELAGGCGEDIGLTPAGREIVPLLEDQGILPDVSHLGEQAFWQVVDITKGPLVASHSNSRALCPHPRNLTDDQFRVLVDRGGLVGVTFVPQFLAEKERPVTPDHLLGHIRHFLALGGADILALGSDFDGTDVPEFASSPEKLALLGEHMVKSGLDRELTEKILWRNARDFFLRTLGK